MHERLGRRDFIKKGVILATATAIDNLLPNTEVDPVDLGQYSAHVIAHNAANNPLQFERALQSRVPFIEADLLEADGKLVVAHNSFAYRFYSPQRRDLQDPSLILSRIQEAGKHPFLDLKSSSNSAGQIHELLGDLNSDENAMISSNNHKLLLSLREKGFVGRIFFSISVASTLRLFLDSNASIDYSRDNFGVSIRHDLLWYSRVSEKLKEMGLSVAAWSPNSTGDIAKSITNGADFVTSDKYEFLERISPKAA